MLRRLPSDRHRGQVDVGPAIWPRRVFVGRVVGDERRVVTNRENPGVPRVAAAGKYGAQLDIAVLVEKDPGPYLGLVVFAELVVEFVFRRADALVGETPAGDQDVLATPSYGRAVTTRLAREGAFPAVVGRLRRRQQRAMAPGPCDGQQAAVVKEAEGGFTRRGRAELDTRRVALFRSVGAVHHLCNPCPPLAVIRDVEVDRVVDARRHVPDCIAGHPVAAVEFNRVPEVAIHQEARSRLGPGRAVCSRDHNLLRRMTVSRIPLAFLIPHPVRAGACDRRARGPARSPSRLWRYETSNFPGQWKSRP